MDELISRATQLPVTRVLVVDDDVILGGALCDLLRQRDFGVVGRASSGPEGIAISRQEEPDVVLMDFRMPSMDGLEASTLIRAHSPMTQVVMFTAYDDETLDLEASQSGVYCLLVKGCNPDLIMDMVKQAATRKRELESRSI